MKTYIKPTSPKQARVNQPKKDSKTKKKQNKNINEDKECKKKKIYKSQKITPTKDSNVKELYIRKNDTPKEKKHPQYGTSNLDKKFSKEFLDKLGVQYQYQFKAESIGRYFDFYITPCNLIIELNGSYWHSDPRLYEGKELTPTQKKNKRVDRDKKKWADEHRIPIIYIWEKDVNENPKKVMDELKRDIKYYKEVYNKELEKKKRPNK